MKHKNPHAVALMKSGFVDRDIVGADQALDSIIYRMGHQHSIVGREAKIVWDHIKKIEKELEEKLKQLQEHDCRPFDGELGGES